MYDTLFSDFLSELDVPHTHCYSDREFCAMPFQSLFGLKKLLQSYGVESEGLRFDDKTKIDMLPVPFLARITGGYVIVTRIGSGSVEYLSEGERL